MVIATTAEVAPDAAEAVLPPDAMVGAVVAAPGAEGSVETAAVILEAVIEVGEMVEVAEATAAEGLARATGAEGMGAGISSAAGAARSRARARHEMEPSGLP